MNIKLTFLSLESKTSGQNIATVQITVLCTECEEHTFRRMCLLGQTIVPDQEIQSQSFLGSLPSLIFSLSWSLVINSSSKVVSPLKRGNSTGQSLHPFPHLWHSFLSEGSSSSSSPPPTPVRHEGDGVCTRR